MIYMYMYFVKTGIGVAAKWTECWSKLTTTFKGVVDRPDPCSRSRSAVNGFFLYSEVPINDVKKGVMIELLQVSYFYYFK